VFKPLRIVGYSGCCHLGCPGSLNGRNNDSLPDFNGGVEYLEALWDEELALFTKWWELLGLAPAEYEAELPRMSVECVTEKFAQRIWGPMRGTAALTRGPTKRFGPNEIHSSWNPSMWTGMMRISAFAWENCQCM
jgi:hypothetical protein